VERQTEQPALAPRVSGHPRHRVRVEAAVHDAADPARPLGDQHAAVGQERQAPGDLQTGDHGLDPDADLARRPESAVDLDAPLVGLGDAPGNRHQDEQRQNKGGQQRGPPTSDIFAMDNLRSGKHVHTRGRSAA
jgi:hypothetical protein